MDSKGKRIFSAVHHPSLLVMIRPKTVTFSSRLFTTVDHTMSRPPMRHRGHESHRLHGTTVCSEEEHVMAEYAYPAVDRR